MMDSLENLPNVNRIEVIDENGRSYVNMDAGFVRISYQDDGETLKIFIDKKEE